MEREEVYKEPGTLWDQTNDEWLTPEALNGLGTGMFLFKDENGELVDKDFVKDLTYDQAKEQAETAICFRWIPYTLLSYEDLVNGNYESG